MKIRTRVFAVLSSSLLFANVVLAQVIGEHPPVGGGQVRMPLSLKLAGLWEAKITNAAGIQVPFGLLFERAGSSGVRAFILNGSERIPFTSTTLSVDAVRMRLEQYDGTLSGKYSDGELQGEWTRQTSQGVKHYAFIAQRTKPRQNSRADWVSPSLNGQWEFTFEGPSNNPDRVAPGQFDQRSPRLDSGAAVAEVEGTIAPVSGDFGLLAGTVTAQNGKEPTFRLSRFDGIHILLLSGEFLLDGTIRGKLNTQAFTAVKKIAAEAGEASASTESNPEAITTMKNPDEIFRFTARDPKTGVAVTQDDPRFKGKPYIVDIFGTWCPNCHDEAPVLEDLYQRYHPQGLEIVAVAYEYVDDQSRNARLLDIYRKKYALGFPMLLAGTTDEGQIAKTLPQLQGFGAFPTTIFVGADGKVKKIHAGFAGPATGERFPEVKRKFDENVKALLAR